MLGFRDTTSSSLPVAATAAAAAAAFAPPVRSPPVITAASSPAFEPPMVPAAPSPPQQTLNSEVEEEEEEGAPQPTQTPPAAPQVIETTTAGEAPVVLQGSLPEKEPSPSNPTTTTTTTTTSLNGATLFAGRPIFVFTRLADIEEEAARVAPVAGEEHDEGWYEVTEADVRVQMAGYAARRAQEGKMLMTQQMREAEAARKAASYGNIPVRIEFPDGMVVQASFAATAPLAELRDLVESALSSEAAAAGFYLFVTPPRTELKDMSASFYSQGLVPAARVHVGYKNVVGGGGGGGGTSPSSSSSSPSLKPEVMALSGKPPSRAAALKPSQKNTASAATGSTGVGGSEAGPSTRVGGGDSSREPGEQKRAKPGGVPSWMKLSSR